MLDSSVFILVVDILISGRYFNFILDKGIMRKFWYDVALGMFYSHLFRYFLQRF